MEEQKRPHLLSSRSRTLARYLASELRKQKSRQRMKSKNSRDQSAKRYLKRSERLKQNPVLEAQPTNKCRTLS